MLDTQAPTTENEDARWQAVLHRDRAADGQFYYSVATTGVYCRPSCAARRPLRENVQFFATSDAAERAGFRPCKRCRPREANPDARQSAMITAACQRLRDADYMPSLDELAADANLSRFRFAHVFKDATGVTPRSYFLNHRSSKLKGELPRARTVTDAIYNAGFNSSGRFYAQVDDALGMTPTQYRKGGAGTRIRFAVGQSSLGAILVAGTERGICSITLGDDPDPLLRDLQDRFPKAELIGADAEFERWVAEVTAYVEGTATDLRLPLDVKGTAFQIRVWNALREIRPGETASYAQVAERIGNPRSVRAVAQACASNPIAIAIPCHRVIRQDNSLSGYRWGIERKQRLLQREELLGRELLAAVTSAEA